MCSEDDSPASVTTTRAIAKSPFPQGRTTAVAMRAEVGDAPLAANQRWALRCRRRSSLDSAVNARNAGDEAGERAIESDVTWIDGILSPAQAEESGTTRNCVARV